ncbi:EAL domain-containing protein [Terasakiella sp. A23]|uniref:EAL domain-containing protein n=1 Tax=Terasakiella sp. FCG-A23 TaxID=3080561 RepID=UPI002952EE4F|nr:EAL domain-containing protein [Terasakiella sp. A23]MDV7340439.1 EAL domain-containing protein [Terasakiella sp. A23]
MAILIVEGAILIFSVNNFERDRLLEVEREGLSVVRSWLQISSESPETLNKMAPMIGNGSVLLSAEVQDKTGQEIASLMNYSILAPVQESFEVEWGEEELGYPLTVKAMLDKTEIPNQINDFIWRIVGLVLVISFFVTAVTMVILERFMLSPIRTLRGKMNEATTDLAHPEDHLMSKMRDDELGDVAISYNGLLQRLSSAFAEIRVQQDNLLSNNEKLESEVSARTKELKAVVQDLRREAAERERAEKALDASNGAMSAEHLKKIAYTDTLTGLANRDLFMDRCNVMLRQMKRTDLSAAVHLIDLDGFNAINQNYGQHAGDTVLQTVADRLNELVRDSDTLARLSADEFALVQLDVEGTDGASILAQRIVDRISQPIECDDEMIEVTCSIGITLLTREDDTAEDVLHHVTLARRRAKEESGSSYQFYVEEMNREAMERQAIERDLKKAIANNELEVYYQPKLDVHTGQVSGMEALIRWNHPERGFMSPGLFIPIAERSSLIVSIGDWVLREATRQARRWQAEGLGELKVAVNVSAVQLKEICMVTQVRQVLLESGLQPHLLELEITESAVMEDVEHTISVLEDLRSLGVSLSIDDFGTGYSSLNYIKRFPVKRIKIDKAFVDEIVDESSDGVIARAVITMGHSMGMEITAEGVEDSFQHNFLSAHGVDEIQGFLFGKPMNATDFEDFVIQQSKAALAA